MSNYNSKWFAGLDKDSKEKLKGSLDAYLSEYVFIRLREILEDKEQELRKTSYQDYDNNSWAYYQAHKNGQLSMLEEVYNLIKRTTK